MSLLLLLLLQAPTAQAADRQARVELRQKRRATAQLQEITDSYWQALRWNKVEQAAAFLVDPDERMDWIAQGVSEPGKSFRGVRILHIEVGPGLEDDPEGDEREATVLIEVEVYGSDQVIRREVRQQTWVLRDGSWYVAPGQRVGEPRPQPSGG
ncbi:MAG: hypothetical protein VX899_19970 [Myxococcota bacterium]|nr:hypothetical protein [Myxococcota bacterium]